MTQGREILVASPIIAPNGDVRLPSGALKAAAFGCDVGDWFMAPSYRRGDSGFSVASVLTRRYAPMRFGATTTPNGVVIRRLA